MRHRIHTITSPIGWPKLSVHQQWSDGRAFYVGIIDGSQCVSAPSREAAVSALLRRAIHRVLQ
ncbi:MAG: hypothetical protein KF910_09160 [Brevundimonas sp.]|uniref:hypothetical protein n=1 Tax=Brevundimonas sp. TaxID=1871086 RepID=UPI0025C5D835|nr:hypothetical protein [Brevundimonas sp.]MBX3477765.1 hypothetical protein [Brevundimonas sp.]